MRRSTFLQKYHMKRYLLLLCVSVCLLLIVLPLADAACNSSVTPRYTLITDIEQIGPYGSIYVESSPSGAVISLNGANQGHAPVTISGLYPGTYTITAKISGYEDFTSSTTISGATRSMVYCPMVPENNGNGLYIVSTPEKANVYIDGTYKGVTPIMLGTPGTGSHTIEVRLSGYENWRSTVDVPEGGTKTIAAILVAQDTDANRGISVSSKPAGARVLLDGLPKGYTPVTLTGISSGIHILELEYTGYTSWKSTLDVPETGIKAIAVNLTPKAASSPGWITVFSSPENATVTLDGDYVGLTMVNSSLNLNNIIPGDHAIVLELPGYTPYSALVTVSPNQVSTVHATLIPVSGSSAKGILSVTSDPAGATISVDNKSIGMSPLTADNIAAGYHVVNITLEGYQVYSTSIHITAETPSNVSATLQPVTSSLHTPVFPLSALAALGIFCIITLRKKY
jgi:hypothetical protein